MSELFKALQRLEEQSEQSVPVPPPPESNNRTTGRGIPYLRAILLLLLSLLIAGGILFLVYLYRQNPSLLSLPGAPVTSQPPQEQPLDTPPEPMVEENVPVRQTTPAAPDNSKDTAYGLTDTPVPPETEETAYGKEKDEEQVLPAVPLSSEEIQELEVVRVDMDKNNAEEQRDIKRKRLLYRAEKLRTRGDLAGALSLYREVWQQGQDASIANNIAAILLSMGEYEEAEQYLRQALLHAPDDQDLLFNLEITLRGKEQRSVRKQKSSQPIFPLPTFQ